MKTNRLLSLIAAGLLLLPTNAMAQEEALEAVAPGNSVLAVSGRGELKKTPDVAIYRVSVITTGATAREALDANSETMRNVFKAIDELGISENDVQTSRVGLEPMFDRSERIDGRSIKVPEIIGYTAANQLLVTQRQLSDFGTTIDRLVAAGANAVQGPTFGLADSSAESEEVRIAAIKDARAKADLYAKAAGLKVVRILTMNDGRYRSSAPANEFGFLRAMESGVPVAAGEIEVSATFNLVFELAPK